MLKHLFGLLAHMPRVWKQMMMLMADLVLLSFSVWAAYALRFGDFFVPNEAQFILMAAAPLLAVPIFLKMGLYRSVIRYMGEHALWSVLKGVALSTLVWSALAFMTQMTGAQGVPRAVPLLYGLLSVVLIGGVRFSARWLLWLPQRVRYAGRQVLIYGAGNAGRQLAASLQQGRSFFPAGFLDDNLALHGKDIGGLRVYAPKQLPILIRRFDIHDVIVTLPTSSHARRKEVVAFLEQYSLRVRILPALSDIASGRHLVNMLREVDIGDLLGREVVAADQALLARCITGKNVLITGAGGSIGSELCRQIAALNPSCMVLLESNEHALYQIHRSLVHLATGLVIPCLGCVQNRQLITALLEEHAVHTVYHAAAHKHVPLVEHNVIEGVRNNIFGTRALAQAVQAAQVETFVLISTDKAVRPTNVMGATKRWAELIVQDCAERAKLANYQTRFCAVRFGNVLGSSGSVIPLFKEQIAQGGPVTVTHAHVTRYFMSIHEAVELVIQAGSFAQGGEIFLLDMGEPIKIIDLAQNMIRLAGHSVRDELSPQGDIEIVVTGLRPGEKLYEELLIAQSNAQNTSHPKIMHANEYGLHGLALDEALDQLAQAMEQDNVPLLRRLLMDVANQHSA